MTRPHLAQRQRVLHHAGMTYLEDAQRRARRRKSPWNLLLLATVLLFLGLLSAAGAGGAALLHQALYPAQTLRTATGLGAILAVCGPFFGALPLAMQAGNASLRRLRPARDALSREAGEMHAHQFHGSQRQLIRITTFVLPCAVAVTLCGALLPW